MRGRIIVLIAIPVIVFLFAWVVLGLDPGSTDSITWSNETRDGSGLWIGWKWIGSVVGIIWMTYLINTIRMKDK